MIAYSLPPCRYTGDGNVTVVELDASVDVLTSAAATVTSENGNIL